MREADARFGAQSFLSHDGRAREITAGVERRVRLAAWNWRGRQVEVIDAARIDERRRQRAAAHDRNDPNPPLEEKSIERLRQIDGRARHDRMNPGTLARRLRARSRPRLARDDEHRHVRHVEDQIVVHPEMPAAADDDLRRMTRPPEGGAQRDDLRMPYGKEHVGAAGRMRPGEDRVGVHPGEPFVHQVMIRLAAAERGRIVRHGVAVSRLDEHEIDRPAVGMRRPVERPAEACARPRGRDRPEIIE